MKNYAVTIGIPVYNVEKYIRLAMDSALAQTFNDIEFLVIDDCGTDSSIDIVREYQQTHPRGKDIRVVRQPKNGGIGEARNCILEEANGHYLYFMDADDMVEPQTIQLLYEKAIVYQADLVYASHKKINYHDDYSTEVNQYLFRVFEERDSFASYFFQQYGKFQTTVWNCLMKKSVIRDNKLRFIDAVYWEDMAFAYELVSVVNRVVLLPEITYHYMCRTNTLSGYQKRSQIPKEEILKNVSVVNYLKDKCCELKGKLYLPYMCYDISMNGFYIVKYVLKYRHIIVPRISNQELKDYLSFPLSLKDILNFKSKWLLNLVLWAIPHLPNPLLVFVVRTITIFK